MNLKKCIIPISGLILGYYFYKKFKTIEKNIILIELGGTGYKIKIVKNNNFDDSNFEYFETKDPLDTLKDIIKFVDTRNIIGISIASFGPVQTKGKEKGKILKAPSEKKEKWKNFNLLKELQQFYQVSENNLKISTDVNSSALGEYYKSFNEKYENIAYITVGTGVGVGLVLNGKPYFGRLHPEGGHMVISKVKNDWNFNGVCKFHNNCCEGYCTNYSIAQRLNSNVNELKNLPDNLELWDDIGIYLAQICCNLSLLLSLDKIVIGGGVIERQPIFKSLKKEFKLLINNYISIENIDNYIIKTELKNNALYGCYYNYLYN